MVQSVCKENKESNCRGCLHEYVVYVKNGTKSFCDIDGREIFFYSKRCDAYTREQQII